MKKKIIYSSVILLAGVLQTSSAVTFFGSEWPVDFVLMLVLAWTLIDGFDDFLPWAVFAGIVYDAVSFSPIGSHIAVFSLVAYGVSFFSRRFSIEMGGAGILSALFFIAAATIGSRYLIFFLEIGFEAIAVDFSNIVFLSMAFAKAAIFNGLIFLAWFFIIGRIQDFFFLKTKERKIFV